jgi:hypothetical protein
MPAMMIARNKPTMSEGRWSVGAGELKTFPGPFGPQMDAVNLVELNQAVPVSQRVAVQTVSTNSVWHLLDGSLDFAKISLKGSPCGASPFALS